MRSRARATPACRWRQLKEIGLKLTRIPKTFKVHRTMQRVLDARRKMIEDGAGLDWAMAEHLAFGTLLLDGFPVRLSGQDVQRGTFSQRHAVLVDQETEKRYTPLNHLVKDQKVKIDAINSMLSEEAVLGFEYGYSLAEPNTLDHLGSAVRRLRQRRAGGVRPVHLVGRTQVAAHVGPHRAAAARLRGPGAGTFLRPPRALSADVRGRQHAGGQLHDARQLLPHPAPPAEARHPQAAGHHDAEVAAAPQARHLAARHDGRGHHLPPPAVGRCPDAAGRGDQAEARRRRSAASSCAPARSITISTRSARSAASTTSTCCASSSSIRGRTRR